MKNELKEFKKKMEQNLNFPDKDKYYSLLSHLHEDIIVIDKNHTIVYIGANFLHSSGFSREEVVGEKCFKISHGYKEPCHHKGETCLLQQVFESGEVQRGQHIHLKKDGSKTCVEVVCSPIRDEKGEVIYMVESIRDVTALLMLQDLMIQNDNLFQSIFDHAPIAIVVADLKGSFIKVNDQFCKMLGYSSAELTKLTFRDITHPDDLESDLEQVKKLRKGKIQKFQLKKRYLTKEGNIQWVLLNASVARDAKNNPLHYIGQILKIEA